MKRNSKGFTMAELLIVVAIIAVLVAIAIPVFSSSLEKARVATDEANVRSWYADVVVKYLDDDTYTTPATYGGKALVAKNATAVPSGDLATGTFKVTYSADYQSTNIVIGGAEADATPTPTSTPAP